MVYLFRAAFVIALLAGTHLATTDAMPNAVASLNDKIQHFAAFAVLAFLLDQCFSPRLKGYLLPVALPLLAYGAAIEVVQHFLPHRSFDVLDFAADGLGLLLYWLLRPLAARLPFLPRPSTP